ncbi:transposase [Catellatospora tritici]|uniref:transposase n=1 Tax=Catellatospora tritici TaxID=2851566 RepID=UPI001C2DF0FC|nr:transposase [Catellatospora tritici]
MWDRTQAHNRLRSLLREFFPGFLQAFGDTRGGIMRGEARAVLAAAPTPAAAQSLTAAQTAGLLRQGGRRRGADATAVRLNAVFQQDRLRQPVLVEQAMGVQALALLRAALDTACHNVDTLAEATEQAFNDHPDAEIISSFAGLGPLTGARVLAEIGDDRTRFADARSIKAFAGSAPVTRASGKSLLVMHRRIKNQRLATTGHHWAFSALTASPGARTHYDRRRATGEAHTAALRNLFNRLLGCLHHCLQTGQTFNEKRAFTPRPPSNTPTRA